MSDRVLIRKADGSEASVIEADFKKHYPDESYKVIGKESDQAFALQGVPAPRAARRAPRAKGKKAAAARPVARIPEPEHPKPSEVISPPVTEA